MRSGQVPTDPGFEQWLLKLDGVGEENVLGSTSGWGRIEYAYSELAHRAGVEMTACRLLEENGRAHFMTRRFDRLESEKTHTATLCALAHLDFRAVGVHDYAQLFWVIDALDLGAEARREAFRRMVFNVVAANCDDHTKNTSFTMTSDGRWSLAPAYDLVWAHDPKNTWTKAHLMAVDGRTSDITAADVMEVADRFRVPFAAVTVDEVLDAVSTWPEVASTAGVADDMAATITADRDEVRATFLGRR